MEIEQPTFQKSFIVEMASLRTSKGENERLAEIKENKRDKMLKDLKSVVTQ